MPQSQTAWSPRFTVSRVFYSFFLSEERQADVKSIDTPIEVSSEDSYLWKSDDDAVWIGPEQQLARILVESFKQVPQVKSICAQFDADGITIWTLLESYDREAREKVYERELDICQRLGLYDFDFRVTSFDLVSSSDLVKTGSIEIFKRP
ncbi:MAG: hypothetical protein ACRERD_07785 [Candidatus Binatia bacterium]